MGYRGKLWEKQRARELRAESWTLQDIATELGVAKSSVSLWVRNVEFEPRPRRIGAVARRAGPNKLRERKEREIAELLDEGRRRIGRLSEREFLVAGTALYAGEGTKQDGDLRLANSDPRMILFFCTWLRHFFTVDESPLRVRLYLHEGLDLEGANRFWSDHTGIPLSQFGRPYRAVPDSSIRRNKHPLGCPASAIVARDTPTGHGTGGRPAILARVHSGVAQ